MIGNRSVVRALAYAIVARATLAALIRRLVVVVTVRGTSMEPTYHDGDRLLSVRPVLRRMLRPGRVAVGRFATTDNVHVKRAIGIGPGRVDLELQSMAVPLRDRMQHAGDEDGRVRWDLDDGQVFVRGDHPQSADSVVWGPANVADVIAVAVARLPLKSPRSADLGPWRQAGLRSP